MKVSNKIFVVTGAGSGIGRALCLDLLARQARVAGVDLHENTLLETQSLANVGDDRFKSFVADIADKAKVERLPDAVAQHFGAVDGIINNAGIIQRFVPVKDLSLEDVNRVFNVNFYGTLYMVKAFLPHLLKRPEAHIANISSMGGFLPVPGQTIYGASKAAVKLLTEGLHSELRNTSVKVSVVFPGAVATNISQNSGLVLPENSDAENSKFKPLAAEKAATIIVEGIERDKYRILVGSDASFLDKLYRLAPQFAANFIAKKMASLLKL